MLKACLRDIFFPKLSYKGCGQNSRVFFVSKMLKSFKTDLDIATNNEGIEIFRNALKKFIVKDFFSQKINGRSLVCDINGFEVEINSYGDRELDMFDRTEKILWNDLQIYILPLEYAKKFYELIDRKEKVALISKHLSG